MPQDEVHAISQRSDFRSEEEEDRPALKADFGYSGERVKVNYSKYDLQVIWPSSMWRFCGNLSTHGAITLSIFAGVCLCE